MRVFIEFARLYDAIILDESVKMNYHKLLEIS